MIRLTALAQSIVAHSLSPGDFAFDGTAGNGHDTLFLARTVGPMGKVLAIDIQPAAIEATRRMIALASLENVEYRVGCHAAPNLFADYSSKLAAALFNLGWLPGGDHRQITRTSTTLTALEQAFAALKTGGILSVISYPGHDGGQEESRAVTLWFRELGPRAQTAQITLPPTHAPRLHLGWKR